MPWWLAVRGQTLDRESVGVRLLWQPGPLSWECNAGITKIKAREGKGEQEVTQHDAFAGQDELRYDAFSPQ